MRRVLWKLLVIGLALFVSVGSTVAYLTDVDQDVNVMTLDRVEIDLIEEERGATGTLVEFVDNHPLYPGVHPDEMNIGADGYWTGVHNAVDKIVTVKNTGKAPTYVRLWFAFEVTGNDSFFDEKLHLNNNATDWRWEFLKNQDGSYAFLKQNDTRYVVAVATYDQALISGATTPRSLVQVLLDSSATNDDFIALGDKYSILVVAQGMQTAGFDSAVEALNEGFGAPEVGNHPFEGMGENDTAEEEASPVTDFEWTITADRKSIIIIRYIGSDTNVVVPSVIDDLPVIGLGNAAFQNCKDVIEIVIPEGVTQIGQRAFCSCSKLATVSIPDSVNSIGEHAFEWCTSLTSVIIPENVTCIEASTFNGCTNLTSITLPDSVISIGACAFQECTSLANITIPENVTSIGFSAFNSCRNLTSINIPDGVTSIEMYTFHECTSLTDIKLPENLISIDGHAFYNCSNLMSIHIPDSVTSIGAYAFGECASLTSIIIPDKVTSIGDDAFDLWNEDLVFTVTAGSYAQTWCEQNGIVPNIVSQ